MDSRHEKSEVSHSFRARSSGRIALGLLTAALLPLSIVPAFAQQQNGMEKVALVETADISLGISATPLGNQVLSQYRGTGEQGVTPATQTQHVAVILWDERGAGNGSSAHNSAAGYGSNQVSNVVSFHVR
jgi:hypothetical protein